MKGAQRATHPSDPGAQKRNMKGAEWEPSFLAAAHPSGRLSRGPPIRPRSPERKYEGSPMGAQLLCRGPPI